MAHGTAFMYDEIASLFLLVVALAVFGFVTFVFLALSLVFLWLGLFSFVGPGLYLVVV
jgi:hypothetical protein